MSHIIREQLTDCSTADAFRFSLSCAQCGGVWESTPVRFSRSGVTPETPGKQVIFDTLYRQEKDNALTRSVRQAEGAFNQCPVCGRLVCDCCFLVCEELDLCMDCAGRLQEQGVPVAVRTA